MGVNGDELLGVYVHIRFTAVIFKMFFFSTKNPTETLASMYILQPLFIALHNTQGPSHSTTELEDEVS